MCYAELNMAMKVPYVQSRNSSSNLVYFLLLSLSLAVWPNVWPPVQSLEDSWGTKMPINIEKNRYSQETSISMTKTYEDPNIFWMSCFFLLVVILSCFFSSFLIFFVFPFYPQEHGNLIQIIWVTYVTWHSSHHPLVPPPLPPSSSAARRGNVRCSRMVSYLGEPDLTCWVRFMDG